ncbi:glycosyltransferase [Flavobacterium capsici]|uniref:Glycosyltransferase n=1 Tax=Flavobacterium capsici TaxID=3075618 RepID=A0AA96EZ24_9FLAO|nr:MULTISPECIES: glycosyltransferase [unclassified Flavobacterium]WNM19667.1 glycosyltransferase [Flavobacterium sp. PMR2A8]WNM21056.1 glycosyltransferase [Flavobacterium sp. PMTSA4]
MQKIAIIIPCYNEEKRIKKSDIDYLILNSDVTLFFANDGSKDKTVEAIEIIISNYQERCFLIDFKENSGKANTIYKAINQINKQNQFDFIGYFDADFSTPAEELVSMLNSLKKSEKKFIFGSRILLLNSGIKRKFYRHIIGRIILTLINFKHSLGIYDTQCGAKIFSKEIIKEVFEKPFKTKWLFDVEIFIRLKEKNLLQYGKEIPVYNWKDVDGSKLGFSSSISILKEIGIIAFTGKT